MKTFLILIALLFVSGGAQAQARDSLMLFAGALAGVTTTANQAYYGRLPEELEGWTDHTKSTAMLGKTCGLLMETRLLRGSRQNYMFVGLSNSSSVTKNLALNKMEFHFGSGKVRFPSIEANENSYELKAGWYVWGFVPFPRKTDFEGENKVALKLPVTDAGATSTCIAESAHVREASTPAPETSYLEYTVFQMSIEFGAHVLKTGRLDKLHSGGDNFAFNLQLEGFRDLHNGSNFMLAGGSLGSPNANFPGAAGLNLDSNYTMIGLGYTRREILSRRHSLYATLGLAYTGVTLSYDSGDGAKFASYGYYSIYNNLVYDYVFASVLRGFWAGDHAVGLVLSSNYIPGQKSHSVEMEGINTALTLRYRVGY